MVDILRLLDFIRSFSAEHGYAPSVRDVRDGLGLSSTSIADYWLTRAEAEGLLVTDPNVARSIRLVEKKEVESGN